MLNNVQSSITPMAHEPLKTTCYILMQEYSMHPDVSIYTHAINPI